MGVDNLTPRQRQVLLLLARGLLYKEIARDLGVSAQTIKNHVTQMVERSGAEYVRLLVWEIYGCEVMDCRARHIYRPLAHWGRCE